ncbi:hypothetical protein KI387_040434, partial [Taxus chinensis]
PSVVKEILEVQNLDSIRSLTRSLLQNGTHLSQGDEVGPFRLWTSYAIEINACGIIGTYIVDVVDPQP